MTDTVKTYSRLLRYIKPYRLRLIVGLISGLISGVSVFGVLGLLPNLLGSLSGKEGSSGSDSEPDEDELLELGWDQEAAEEEWLESEEYEKAEANRKRLKAQSDIRKLATLGRFLVAHEGPVPEGAAADQQEGKGAVFDPALATLDAETSYSMDTNEK